MRASLRRVGSDRRSPSGRVLPAALLVLLATTTACGDNRGKPASTGDTTGTATGAAVTDTANTMKATTPTSDSTTAATGRDTSQSDSTARPTTAQQPSDSTRKRPQSAEPRPVTKRVATASQDTGVAAPTQTELRDAYHQPPHDTVSQAVYNGWKQFNLNCARCHGEDVSGTTIAPHLIVSLRPDGPINTKEIFVQTVCAGRPAKGMPAWCTLGLGADKILEIYGYVKGRSEGKIAPGRPAVRQGT
jgi:mono/diheme cytochrome c family protein